MCQPIHVCGLLSRRPMRAMPLCLCPCLCFFFLSFSLLHILIRPLGRTFGGVRDGSSPSCGIKALLVSWLTLWRTLTRTHTHTPTLAGFTTPCILLGPVLAGRLKDSLKDHLIGDVPSHVQDSCFFPLLSETFMYSAQLMRGRRWPD